MTRRTVRLERTSTRRPRRGYAMVLTMALLAVLALVTSAAVIAGQSELSSSGRFAQMSYARQFAAAGLDEFYASVLDKPSLLNPVFAATPGQPDHKASDCDVSAAGPAGCPSPRTGWASLTAGIPTPCGPNDFTQDCYQLHVAVDRKLAATNPSEAHVTPIRSAVVQITTRTSCRNPNASAPAERQLAFDAAKNKAANCVWKRFQQRLRERQPFDYLYFTQFSTLAPVLYEVSGPQPDGYGDWREFAEAKCAGMYGLAAGTRPLGADAPQSAIDNPASALRDPQCIDVSFRGQSSAASSTTPVDVLSGPLYTGDDWINVCGGGPSGTVGPNIKGPIVVAGAGNPAHTGSEKWWRKPPECSATTNNGSSASPAPSTAVGQDFIKLPDETTARKSFASVAGPSHSFFPAEPGGTVTLSLVCPGECSPTNRTSVIVAGSTRDGTYPYPPSGVVYVGRSETDPANDANSTENPVHAVVQGPSCTANVNGCPKTGVMDGKISGALSIYADGTLTVGSSLIYQNCTGAPGCPAQTVEQMSTNHTDLLGLTANDSVQIAQLPDKTTEAGKTEPLTLDAVILSTTSAVSVTGWQGLQDGYETGSAPTLVFFGAMAGRYQGVFGGYDPATGALRSGYAKSFTFDCRLSPSATCGSASDRKLVQPPFLMTGSSARWARIDTTEVPALGSNGELRAGGIS